MDDDARRRETHDKPCAADIGCPNCGNGLTKPMGRVGSRLDWRTCVRCDNTWAVRATTSTESEAPPVSCTARAERDRPDGAGALALVIDDDALVLELLAETIERFNYRVVRARDGAEALEQVTVNGTDLRLVTTDLNMPNTDGVALVRALRQMLPATPLLVISGLIGERQMVALREIGVTDVLPKPLERWSLARAILRGAAR